MKKFFIPFIPLILLFVFLISVPQIAWANAPYPPYIMEKIKQGKEKPNELKKTYGSCLKKYKSKLPKKYEGPNLKFENKKVASSALPYVVEDRDVTYWFETDNEYFIDVNSNGTTNTLRRKSMANDCNSEYIDIYDVWPLKSINLIDVPVGSHLTYIPETDEMQVLTPKKDSKYITDITLLHQTITELSKQIKEGLEIKNKKDLECVNKKKASLTEEYTGPNLKYETVLNHSKDGVINSKKHKHCIDRYSQSELPTTQNKYNIESPYTYHMDYRTGKRLPIESKSLICGCEEYILIGDNNNNSYAYNVTNIPPLSTLKFLPETKEMQIIPFKEENIKEKAEEELKRKDKLMCLYNKKLSLPQKYKGSNLKLQNRKTGGSFTTGLNYHHMYVDEQWKKIPGNSGISAYGYSSIMYNDEEGCNEYLRVQIRGGGHIDDIGNVNITDVPANSYLKYIPETKKIKVLVSEDKYYNSYIKEKIKDIENKEKELQKSIATGNAKMMTESFENLKKTLDKSISLYETFSPEERKEHTEKFKKASKLFLEN